MTDLYTEKQIKSLSTSHRNLLHDKMSDEIRYKRKEIQLLEENILLIKRVRNSKKKRGGVDK